MMISDNLKHLLRLLADGQFHSGTELAQALALSRTAVWKHLQALSELGVDAVAVSGKGYKLQRPLQLLDHQQIDTHLQPLTRSLLNRLETHAAIPSTNSYLLERAQLNHDSGWVCLAEYQTAGKGRRGRSWVSPFGHNIYLSILWRFQDGPGTIAGLSLAIGLAVVRALSEAGVDEVGLKWPNDIYWRGRKLAGILIEVSGESSGPCHAVIGLGLNVYMSQSHANSIEQAWVDLQQILGDGATQQRNRLVGMLLNQMLPILAHFEQQVLPDYVEQWREFDCMQGKAATIYIGRQSIDGIIRGVDDRGLLLLEDSEGQLRAFASGEVSFRAA